MNSTLARLSFCALLFLSAAPASARMPDEGSKSAAPAEPDVSSKQVVELPGRTLHFTATAGFIRLRDENNAPEVDIATTAYTLDGTDPATRPVTLVVNGGPGMASAWLQMGAVGPWRIPMSVGPSAPSEPAPNAETWLDFTDLVFIDPAGTGYSRFLAPSDEVRKRLWSVDGDVDALSQTIRRWLDKSGRNSSPKFLLGESYGGFRAPRLARRLAEHDGVGLRGLVMVSPLLDYGNRSAALDLFSDAAALPSMAATALAQEGRAISREDLKDVEEYASGQFLSDILRGSADTQALSRVVDRVSALTRLKPELVRQHRGLISSRLFTREHDRSAGRLDSVYDPTVALADAFPEEEDGHQIDPVLDGLKAPLTSAMLRVYRMLNWHPDGAVYQLEDDRAAQRWDYGHDFMKPESFDALRQALALDPRLHVIIAHGLFDLVCPYYATQLLLNQIPPTAGRDRVALLTLAGGHMLYSRDDSRRALRDEAEKLITGSAAVR